MDFQHGDMIQPAISEENSIDLQMDDIISSTHLDMKLEKENDNLFPTTSYMLQDSKHGSSRIMDLTNLLLII